MVLADEATAVAGHGAASDENVGAGLKQGFVGGEHFVEHLVGIADVDEFAHLMGGDFAGDAAATLAREDVGREKVLCEEALKGLWSAGLLDEDEVVYDGNE